METCPYCYEEKYLIKRCNQHSYCDDCYKIQSEIDERSGCVIRKCWCNPRQYIFNSKSLKIPKSLHNFIMYNYKEIKRCPNCSHLIEKIMGCRAIECKCGYTFCWDCSGTFNTHIGHICKFKRWNRYTMKYEDINIFHMILYNFLLAVLVTLTMYCVLIIID